MKSKFLIFIEGRGIVALVLILQLKSSSSLSGTKEPKILFLTPILTRSYESTTFRKIEDDKHLRVMNTYQKIRKKII